VENVQTRGNLIDLRKMSAGPVRDAVMRFAAEPLTRMLSIHSLNEFYQKVSGQRGESGFFALCLSTLNITIRLHGLAPDRIPRTGPLVAVANHPFGGLDGIILGALLAGARPDTKILGNYFLQQIPEIKELIIPVDPFDRQDSARKNMSPLRETLRWLRSGGALGAFPAGEVAHYDVRRRFITDPAWSLHIAALVRRTRATVLPVYFDGSNSSMFHALGLVHPRLRTVMLPRELMNKQSRTVSVHIGNPIPFTALEEFQSDHAMCRYLRLRTFVLGTPQESKKPLPDARGLLFFKKNGGLPVIPAVPPDALAREVDALTDKHLLTSHRNYSVFAAPAQYIPLALREIGRLREETFREVGEGTGSMIDLDRFDRFYLHLFMWDHDRKRIVGGYRLGQTDIIMPARGQRGLYTTTLFSFKKGFFEKLGCSLELGRSFICADYQKQYNSLSILWRGISEFVARNPRYRVLFGPVSISNDYHALSKNLLVRFLSEAKSDITLAGYVRPRNPVKSGALRDLDVPPLAPLCPTLDHVSAVISEIEVGGKGVPVLLRHYLKLNGAIVSFNLDKKFSRSIDSLLVVDLRKSDLKLLRRFMGQEGLERFLQHQA